MLTSLVSLRPASYSTILSGFIGVLCILAAGGEASAQPAGPAAPIKPLVRRAVAAQAQSTTVRSLTRAKIMQQWRAGDPVIVIEDLKEQLTQEARRGDESRRVAPPEQSPPRQPMVRQPVSPQRQRIALPEITQSRVIRPWKPGEPVRVIDDLKEEGSPQGRRERPREMSATEHRAAGHGLPARSENLLSTLVADFDGIPATGSLPPDTVGDVGPNHYVQAVNTAFAVYDRTGSLLVGPSPINSLWSGFGGPCESENHGDPIVNYDHLADRWLISQFALTAIPHQCFAISQGPDPTQTYFLYGFPTEDDQGNPVFPDYPKIGVWPDGYYMCTQRGFPSGGIDVWVFERDKMLAGQPARVVQFYVPGTSLLLLPSDLDGQAPPAGTPNFFARQVDGERFGGADRVEVFAFQVNWSAPETSTFTQVANIPVDPFDSILGSADLLGASIPQPGTAIRLETLTVWPMWRLQHRQFGTHQTLVFNHTVDANGADLAGIRWYELRRGGSGAWALHQQGTHASNELHRWMGSAAMDQCGNIAVGYSVSSSTEHPGIRFASRLASDSPGTLAQGEVTLVTGSGSQTHSSRRWGNYSTLNVDPADPTTFWYTTEYYDATSAAGWKTRISSFRLPECEAAEAEVAMRHQTSPGEMDSTPKSAPAQAAGSERAFQCWMHPAVNYAGGTPIGDRATAVSVYISDLSWHFAGNSGVITNPAGNGQDAGSGWQYPNAKQFGIVLYQNNGNYWQINGTSPSNMTRITGLLNTSPIYFAVNDTRGNYGDNWGSYIVCVQVDAD